MAVRVQCMPMLLNYKQKIELASLSYVFNFKVRH